MKTKLLSFLTLVLLFITNIGYCQNWTLVQSAVTSSENGDSISVTFSDAYTAGDMLTCIVAPTIGTGTAANVSLSSFSVSNGTSFTFQSGITIDMEQGSTGNYWDLVSKYRLNLTTADGTTITANLNASTSDSYMRCDEWDPNGNTITADTDTTSSGTGNAPQTLSTGTISTTYTNELWIGIGFANADSGAATLSCTPSNNFILLDSTACSDDDLEMAYYFASSTSSAAGWTDDITSGSSLHYAGGIKAFGYDLSPSSGFSNGILTRGVGP